MLIASNSFTFIVACNWFSPLHQAMVVMQYTYGIWQKTKGQSLTPAVKILFHSLDINVSFHPSRSSLNLLGILYTFSQCNWLNYEAQSSTEHSLNNFDNWKKIKHFASFWKVLFWGTKYFRNIYCNKSYPSFKKHNKLPLILFHSYC